MLTRNSLFLPLAAALILAGCSTSDAGSRPYEGKYHGSGQHDQAAQGDFIPGVGWRNQSGNLGDRYNGRSSRSTAPVAKPATRPMDPKPMAPQPMAEPMRPADPMPAMATQGGAGLSNMVTMAFPTGDRRTSAILLEKMGPAEVMVGQVYDYKLNVTNLTSNVLQNVTVNDVMTGNFNMASSNPAATRGAGGNAMWNLGNLQPGETRTITVTGSAGGVGNITCCADVTYNSSACIETAVVAPSLDLRKEAPEKIMACDEATLRYTVTNNGTGVARDVRISDALPAGWKTIDGRDDVEHMVGNLSAGQTQSIDVRVRPAGSGVVSSMATASGAGGLTANSAATNTRICRPVLVITKTGPQKRFAGRNVTYEMTIRNTGDGPANDTMLEDMLPGGANFVSASDGGQNQGNTVRWNLGTLAPNAERRVSLTVSPTAQGILRNTATVRAYCADPVSDSAETSIEGIPAILLEVVDLVDPVEVGTNTTYVITVTNQGSAPDSNIVIAVELEDAAEFVSGTGQTALASATNASTKSFSFSPLSSLAPKAQAEWRVMTKAVSAGDIRIKITMTSTEIGRPVTETEATRHYE